MREKRKSGGARAAAAKAKAREAARRRGGDYEALWRTRFDDLVGAPPRSALEGFSWCARLGLFALYSAATDEGLEPQSRREQISRLLPGVVRALEPAKVSEQLEE